MDLKILAICDTNWQYAKKLMEAFCEKKHHGFQIHVFSNVKELKLFTQKNQLEIQRFRKKQKASNIVVYVAKLKGHEP